MIQRVFALLSAGLLLTLFLSSASHAQERWTWPEKPKNLQVLPKDWPGSRLSAPMRGFTRVLGVRCSHCHVGQEGQPLNTYDFASDDNPNKERAREMMRMLGSINEHLGKLEPSGDKRVNMWCHTCHNGKARPMTLGEELSEVYRQDGVTSALAKYKELKENYYGMGSYRFDDQALNAFGYEIIEDDMAAAVPVFKLNTEEFPESWNAWDSLAEVYMKTGQTQLAIAGYGKSLELNPKNTNAVDMLEKLKAEHSGQ